MYIYITHSTFSLSVVLISTGCFVSVSLSCCLVKYRSTVRDVQCQSKYYYFESSIIINIENIKVSLIVCSSCRVRVRYVILDSNAASCGKYYKYYKLQKQTTN